MVLRIKLNYLTKAMGRDSSGTQNVTGRQTDDFDDGTSRVCCIREIICLFTFGVAARVCCKGILILRVISTS
jgi:hypothetical protein